MASQDISEVIVRVVADTQSAESALRSFGKTRDQALGGDDAARAAKSNADAAVEAEKRATAAIKSERIIRNADLRRQNQTTRLETAQLTDDLADLFRIGPVISDRITGIDKLRLGLRGASQEVVTARTEFERLKAAGASVDQLTAAEERLNAALAKQKGLSAQLSGPGALVRGIGGAFISTAIQAAIATPVFAAAQAAVQAVFEEGAKAVDRLINPTKLTAAAFDELGRTVKGLGGADKFGAFLDLAPNLQAFANAAEKIASQKAGYEALTALLTAAAAAGKAGVTPEEAAFEEARRKNREDVLRGAGIDNPLAIAFSAFAPDFAETTRRAAVAQGPEALAAFDATIQRFGRLGKDGAVSFDQYALALGNAADAAFIAGDAAVKSSSAEQDRVKTANELVAALRSGNELTAKQLDLLKSTTTEQERALLLSNAANAALRQENDLRRQVRDLDADIAELEGEAADAASIRSGDANRDTLYLIDRRRQILDELESRLEEQQFQRERRRQLRDIESSISRAGIRQAGQTSFDVAANRREAELQAQRQREGFRDEDQRRYIQTQRENLDIWERSITRQIELDDKRNERTRVNAELTATIFENGLKGVYETALRYMSLIAAAAMGGSAAQFGQEQTGGGDSQGTGTIGGRSFVSPGTGTVIPQSLSRGSSTIILQSAPIILDGEVVGRAIERRVTARSNRRGALGIF